MVAMGQIHYRTGFGNRGGYGRTRPRGARKEVLKERRDCLGESSVLSSQAAFPLFADDLCGGVESNARIALDIDHSRDLDVGRALESVLVAGLTILHIGLGGHAENNDVAFCP